MTRLILIRHGETEWNAEGRWQGQLDIPLSEKGSQQAKLSADYVNSNFAPRKVWSSDLRRCTKTAEPLGHQTRTSPLLREVSYGDWEGKTFDDLSPADQQLALKKMAWDPDFQAPGGEKFSDLITRGQNFLAESKILDENGDIVVVGHGGAMRGLLVALLDLPPNASSKFHFENASVSIVEADNGLVTLTALNHTAHLGDLQ